jgi:hypothetical protein
MRQDFCPALDDNVTVTMRPIYVEEITLTDSPQAARLLFVQVPAFRTQVGDIRGRKIFLDMAHSIRNIKYVKFGAKTAQVKWVALLVGKNSLTYSYYSVALSPRANYTD